MDCEKVIANQRSRYPTALQSAAENSQRTIELESFVVVNVVDFDDVRLAARVILLEWTRPMYIESGLTILLTSDVLPEPAAPTSKIALCFFLSVTQGPSPKNVALNRRPISS